MVFVSGSSLSLDPATDTWPVDGALMHEADARRVLDDVAQTYGFNGFMVLLVPAKTSRNLADSVVMMNWPEDFLVRYDAAGMLVGSPVIERLRRSTVPFSYDTQDYRGRIDGKGQTVISLFDRYSLRYGVYIPIHDIQGTRGAVGFGRNDGPVSAAEVKELNFICGYIFSEIREARTRELGRLSQREIECLHWAAAGKTTVEMAKILDLSEYTVNHYLNRATRKLDSVNRVQTIAKAIRAGLIN